MLGDIPAAMALADQSLKQLAPEDVHYRISATRMLGINYLRMGKAHASTEILTQAITDIHRHSDDDSVILGLVWLGQAQVAGGNLRRALNTRAEIFRLAETLHRDPPLISYVWAATLYYEWNELDHAAEHWKLAMERQALLRNRSFPEYFVGLARLKWTQGDAQKAYATLEQALNFARQVNNEIAAVQITAQIIQFKLIQGDLDAGLAWLKAHPARPADDFVYFRQDEYLTRTRVLSHQRTPAALAEAGQWLNKLLHHAAGDGRQTDRVKILVLKAITEAYSNNPEQALATLNQALTLAEPENYIRTFLDEGQPLIELLHQAIRHNVAPTYAAHLLKAANAEVPLPAGPAAPPPFSLSEREVEVLKLLSNYYSPQEISDSLVISIHTTRTHIKQIYRKLDVNSRKQAIFTARKLNLV
jgi:LuxR family maltose regulon positive regulatory protein